MMKNIICLLLLFSAGFAAAQSEEERISLEFSNAELTEVLLEIETKTSYRFYFLEGWLRDHKISGKYNQTPISEVLEDIFKETLINFVFLDDKIILTQNNVIYDHLPQGFFSEDKEPITTPEDSLKRGPIFYSANKTPAKTTISTVYIGRENIHNRSRFFTLRGRVINVETGEPVPDLAVLVRDREIGTVTNEQGYYELRLPAGQNILETRSMGNEDVIRRVIIYNDGQLDFALKEDYEYLDEIFLESDPDENVKTAVAGVERIDVKEIKNIPLVLGERDIMKVAATLPGISTSGEGAAGFNVRGGKTDQNLILLDDGVLYNPSHFFGLFSAINPFTTGSIDIYKGNIPAEHGGRLSSVFDIRSKDASTQSFSGEVSLGPVTSNIALEIPVIQEKAGLMVGGRSTYSDWILKSLDEESLQNSQASFYDVLARYSHKISTRTELKATGYYSRDAFSITSDSLFKYNNRMISLRLNHNFNERNRGSVILSNSDYQFDIDYESVFNDDFSTGYNINETEAKLKMDYRHSKAHRITYGTSGKLYRVKPGYLEPSGAESEIEPMRLSNEKGLETAVFLSDEYEVNEKLLLSAGLRYSFYAALGEKEQRVYEAGLPKNRSTITDTLHYGRNDLIQSYSGPEARFSARYFLLPDLSAKISYNNTYQYIHTLSNNTTVSPTDTYKLSDTHIKPQRASQYSLGFYKNFEDNTYELSLEGYYKDISNILDYKVGASLFLNEAIETEVLQGDGRSYGAEILLKKTQGKLNGWVGYTYSRSQIRLDGEFREERVNDGNYFPANFDKRHDVSVVTNYKFTKRFSLSANLVYQTGRPVTIPVGKYYQNGAEYVMYSDRNQFRIPDYYRLDLSFNVEGNHRIQKFAHSFWNISVYNVLGRNNPYSMFFVTEEGEVKAYQSSIFSVPVPTITYNFRF